MDEDAGWPRPPAALGECLATCLGPDVSRVRVVEHSWINLAHGAPLAVTRRDRIYLPGPAAEFFARPELVFHEYFHVLRQWNTGDMTVLRYLWWCLQRGYWNNPYEVEARAFAHAQCVRFGLPVEGARRRIQPSSDSRR